VPGSCWALDSDTAAPFFGRSTLLRSFTPSWSSWFRGCRARSLCLLYAQHIDGAGKQFFDEICRRDLEGVVGKRKNGLYREDRPDWVKIKNSSYSQAEERQELSRTSLTPQRKPDRQKSTRR